MAEEFSPYYLQAKKASVIAQPGEVEASPSRKLSEENPYLAAAEVTGPKSGSKGAVAAADSAHGPSSATVPPTQAAAVSSNSAAGAIPHTQMPPIIRPVIIRPVAAAAKIAPQLTRLINQAPTAGPAVAEGTGPSIASSPALDQSSALAAVQRARRMAAEAREGHEAPAEVECVVCFEALLRFAVRLQPCGHMLVCTQCCRNLLADAESKMIELQARTLLLPSLDRS